MSRTRRWCEIAAGLPVVVVFATMYAWAAPNGDQSQRIDAYLWLALAFTPPMLLWLVSAWLLVHHRWQSAGDQWAARDVPGRLLATAVAAVPEPRRRWGEAMLGELAHVRGRTARWRFALSCARAALLVSIVPGPRGRRWRLPAPVATVAVIGAVVACVAVTVAFVRWHPDATEALSPRRITLLSVVLAGCVGLAMATPRRSVGSGVGGDRLAPHLGVAAAVVFAAGLLITIHAKLDGLVPLWLWVGPMLTFSAPAFTATASGRSFHVGVRAGTWTAIMVMPLTFALLLAEASRQYARDGQWRFAGDVSSARFSVGFALVILVAVPLIGFPFAVIGATVGAESRGIRGPADGPTPLACPHPVRSGSSPGLGGSSADLSRAPPVASCGSRTE